MSRPWNLLVYIAADNTLYNDAQISLRQITDASLFSDIKITVQFDGPSADFASRYKCFKGSKELLWEAPDGYTSDRGTRLSDFLNFVVPNAPSQERIMLVLWGHGAGLDHVYLYSDPQDRVPHHPNPIPKETVETPKDGTGSKNLEDSNESQVPTTIPFDLLNPDNAHANRYLKDIRLAKILADFSRRIGRKIDLLGLDACLMGIAEICHEVSPSVSLIVGSDEELPKGSWPYDSIMRDLTRFPGMDANALSAVIVSRFIEKYTREGRKTRISLSAFSLLACETFATSMKGLVEALSATIEDGVARRKILRARDSSRTPDVADYIDLGVFCQEISESFHDKSPAKHRAKEVLNLLVELPYILYHRDAGENGSIDPFGLGIYFPQVLPPTSQEISAAVQAEKGFHTYYLLRKRESPQTSQEFHLYRPAQGAEPILNSGTKTVTADRTKTVTADRTKTPPADHTKELVSGRRIHRELIGSEILWDNYVALEFNKVTGWANLVKTLIGVNQVESKPNF